MEKLTYKQLGDLIEKAQKGDMDAFAHFYNATYKAQYYTALSILKDSSKAEDAVQETYTYVLDNISKINQPEMIVAYLNRTTRSNCSNILRKDARTINTDFDELEPFLKDEKPTPADIVNEKSEKDLVLESLSSIDKTLSSVLVMRFVQEMKIDDIAKETNLSSRTIKRYIKKGAEEMKKAFEKLKNKAMSLSIFTVPYVARLLHTSQDNSITTEKGQEILNRVIPTSAAATVTPLAAIGSVGVISTALAPKLAVSVVAVACLTATGATMVATPNISFTPLNTEYTAQTADVAIKNNNMLLVSSITVLDQQGNVYLEASGNNATLKIADNGEYTIIVKSLNGKETKESITVNNIDHDCPVVSSAVYSDSIASFVVSDNKSGVDYSSITLSDASNNPIPFEIDQTTGTITYDASYTYVNVYSKDILGNETISIIENK